MPRERSERTPPLRGREKQQESHTSSIHVFLFYALAHRDEAGPVHAGPAVALLRAVVPARRAVHEGLQQPAPLLPDLAAAVPLVGPLELRGPHVAGAEAVGGRGDGGHEAEQRELLVFVDAALQGGLGVAERGKTRAGGNQRG